MSLTVSQQHDLCVCTADAPQQFAGPAHRILSHVLTLEMRAAGLGPWPNRGVTNQAFFRDVVNAGTFVDEHGVIHENSKPSIEFAAECFYYPDGKSFGDVRPIAPEPADAELAALYSEAVTLITSARSSLTNAWVDAKRHRVQGPAAPGVAFRSQELFTRTNVDTTNDWTGDPIVSPMQLTSITLTAGTWRVGVLAALRSESNAANASVGFGVYLDETLVASHLMVRANDPAGFHRQVVTNFDVDDSITVAGTKVLTLRNIAGADEWIDDGLVRFFIP